MPSNENGVVSQCPVGALTTAPGGFEPPPVGQQSIVWWATVSGMSVRFHQVATTRSTEPSTLETRCQGEACIALGFEITSLPVDRLFRRRRLDLDLTPRPAMPCLISAGPPFFTICGSSGLVTTDELASDLATMSTSLGVNRAEKKLWATSTLSSVTQPSVLPSVRR